MTPDLKTYESHSWFVLIVKTGQEKKVAEGLTNLGIEVFCPFKKEIRQWSDRKKVVEVPLFMDYLFVRLQETQRSQVFLIPGIIKYLFWLGKPATVRAIEIKTIKEWLADDTIVSLELNSLKPGKVITIEKGLLKNKTATIRQVRKNELQLVLHDLGFVILARTKSVA